MGSALHGQDGANLVLLNGRVWTGDASQPEAEAIAIRDSRIIAMGTSEAMRKLALPDARIIDLHGRRPPRSPRFQ
jgi:hypothetical protein